MEALETLTRVPTAGPEGGGVRPEQPFIVLGQEEYGEHHSSIMHCRWVLAAGGGPRGKRGWAPWGSLRSGAVRVKAWQAG